MVSGCRKRIRNILLEADAMVIYSRNTSIFPMSINTRLNSRHVWLSNVTLSWQYIRNTRLLLRGSSDFRLSNHTTNCLLCSDSLLMHPNTRRQKWELCILGFLQYWNREVTTIWRPSDRITMVVYVEDTGGRTRNPETPSAPSWCTLSLTRSWWFRVSISVRSPYLIWNEGQTLWNCVRSVQSFWFRGFVRKNI